MSFESWIDFARRKGASDLHLEPGLPLTIRLDGELESHGEPLKRNRLASLLRSVVGRSCWQELERRGSTDLSLTVQGVRTRLNVFKTSRGVGAAVRLLSSFQPTLHRLNLLPEIAGLVEERHGLVIVCGPTGSGKSSTLAALVHEINEHTSRHIVTLEEPIEYFIRPRRSFVRQREVGRDTPSFEQGLHDSLREDPDVLLVGEMRDLETMRLTLSAAETGHLVLVSMHAATAAEAVQRLVVSFPGEERNAIQAQLADSLIGVVSQKLRFATEFGIRLPECEILRATTATRNLIRQGQFFKLNGAIEVGSPDGSWSFQRYREWMNDQVHWFLPTVETESEAPDTEITLPEDGTYDQAFEDQPSSDPVDEPLPQAPSSAKSPKTTRDSDVFVIDPPEEGSLKDILSEFDDS